MLNFPQNYIISRKDQSAYSFEFWLPLFHYIRLEVTALKRFEYVLSGCSSTCTYTSYHIHRTRHMLKKAKRRCAIFTAYPATFYYCTESQQSFVTRQLNLVPLLSDPTFIQVTVFHLLRPEHTFFFLTRMDY